MVPSQDVIKATSMARLKRVQRTWDDGLTNDYEVLEQLCEDIFEVFPHGSQRDVWLALLAQLAADMMWRDGGHQRALH